MGERILVSTSAGKDSTFALYKLQQRGNYEVDTLVTTVTTGYERISMHGVRRDLLRLHAESLGFPLEEVEIPPNCTNGLYEERMTEALIPYRERGIRSVCFGDVHLADVRAYREHNLATMGMSGIFPLWKRDSARLARRFLEHGFKAIVVCVDTELLSKSFLGRTYDAGFLRDLPEGVDPCGEDGEFHTFVFDGPNLSRRVRFTVGEIEDRGRFVYQDLLPA